MNTTTMMWAAALAAGLLAGPASAAEIRQQAELNVNQNFVTTPNGARSHKFEEYRTRPNGVTFDFYGIDVDYEGGYQFSCEAKNVTQLDQSFACAGGRPGALTYEVSWDQTPHVLSNQARTPYVLNPNGSLTLPDGMQNYFQTNAFPDAPGVANNTFYAGGATGLPSFLANTPILRSAMRIDTANIDLKYRLNPDMVFTVGADRRHKTGSRPFGATLGFSNDIEVLKPLDHVTNEARLGFEYARPTHQAAFRYALSDFHNNFRDLIWDNPKRLTDRYASSSGYSAGDQSARGRLQAEPNNLAHSLGLSGGFDLPWRTHVSAEFGYTNFHALNPMQPFTINSAITPASNALLAGTVNDAPFDASNPNNLPDPNVDSKIQAYNQLYRVTTRALPRTKATVEYRSYQQDNESTIYDFPGYVRMDQVWEGEELANKRESFRDERAGVDLDFELARTVNLGLGYGQLMKKQVREVSKTREHQFTASTQYRPSHRWFFNLSYFLGLRRMHGYDLQNHFGEQVTAGVVTANHVFIEPPGLRRFDLADRNRNRARFQTQWSGDGGGAVGFNALVNYDSYRPGKGDLQGLSDYTNGTVPGIGQQYGLLSDRSTTLGIDATVPVGEAWEIETYYDWEYSRRVTRSNASAAGNVTQLHDDDFTYRMGETQSIGGVTLSWTPRAGLKTSVGYDLMASVLHQDPVALGGSTRVQNARSLSPTKRMLQVLRVSQGVQLAKNLRLTGRYAYEKFDVQDYALGDVPLTDPAASAIYLGASLRGYYAHLASVGVDYRF